MALITCPECQNQISDTTSHCIRCGAVIRICPECKKIFATNVEFCDNCGYTFQNQAAAQTETQINTAPGASAEAAASQKQEPAEKHSLFYEFSKFATRNGWYKAVSIISGILSALVGLGTLIPLLVTLIGGGALSAFDNEPIIFSSLLFYVGLTMFLTTPITVTAELVQRIIAAAGVRNTPYSAAKTLAALESEKSSLDVVKYKSHFTLLMAFKQSAGTGVLAVFSEIFYAIGTAVGIPACFVAASAILAPFAAFLDSFFASGSDVNTLFTVLLIAAAPLFTAFWLIMRSVFNKIILHKVSRRLQEQAAVEGQE